MRTTKIDTCEDVVVELIEHGYTDPEKMMILMSRIHHFLKQGDGLIWSQIEEIIKTKLSEKP